MSIIKPYLGVFVMGGKFAVAVLDQRLSVIVLAMRLASHIVNPSFASCFLPHASARKGRQYARSQQRSRACRLASRRYFRRCRKEEALRQQASESERFDATSDLLCFYIAASLFLSPSWRPGRVFGVKLDRCRQGSGCEESPDNVRDVVKNLQMYHVRVVSAISQKRWREGNGVSDSSITGDARNYWVPLIDPKKDLKGDSLAHLRGIYKRLRAAAVAAGVGGEPELEPSFWDARFRPLGDAQHVPIGLPSNEFLFPQEAPVSLGLSAPKRHDVDASQVLADEVVTGGVDATIQDGTLVLAAHQAHAGVAPNCTEVDFDCKDIPVVMCVRWPTNKACATASYALLFEQLLVTSYQLLANLQPSWTQRCGCMRAVCCASYIICLFILLSYAPVVVSIVIAFGIVRCLTALTHVAHGPHCRRDTILMVTLMTCLFGHMAFAAPIVCTLLCLPKVLLWWPPKCQPSRPVGSSHSVFAQDESLSGMSPLRDESMYGLGPRDHQIVERAGDHALRGQGSAAKRRRILSKSRPVHNDGNAIPAVGDGYVVEEMVGICADSLVSPGEVATA